jgi:thiopeptide-type bacteriocin biosynthesis protein
MAEKLPDMRALIDAIVASLRPFALATDRWTTEELTLLTGLREELLTAGAEHLERVHNPARWLQMGVAFKDPEERLSFLCGPLRRAVGRWLSEGRIERFFFMLKPPGLRLRFCGAALDRDLAPRLLRLFERERSAGRLVSHEYGVYDAETYQFGGSFGLEIAHDFFSYDSLAILDLLHHDIPAETLPVLSLTVLNHLVAQICDDPWERWDAWCQMDLTRPMSSDPTALTQAEASFAEQRELLAQTVWEPDAVVAQFPAASRRVLTRYFENNQRLGVRLRNAAKSGRLLYGARKIFPFYGIFHWNRWAIPSEMQILLGFFMRRLLDPKGS